MTIIVALVVFKLPISIAGGAVLEGFYQGVIPIGFIIIMAVWLYKISTESGQFDIVQDSISSISQDQRIQLLLIGFVFNAFLEGAAGFGVPIAICAVLLTQLGFKPLEAAMYCLVANAAAGAYGAVGIPISIIDTLSLSGNVTSTEVALIGNLTLDFISFFIPFLLMFMIDGFKGVKETWLLTLIVSFTYTFLQLVITSLDVSALADIIPGLVSMIVLALVSKKIQPKNIFRLHKDENTPSVTKHSLKDIVYAWSPFIILTFVVLIWSSSFFKKLFEKDGLFSSLAVSYTHLTLPTNREV